MQATRTRFTLLKLMFALSIITYIDRVCVSTAAPYIREALQLTPRQMGWVFSAFTLAYAVFEIPSGWLGDRGKIPVRQHRMAGLQSAPDELTASEHPGQHCHHCEAPDPASSGGMRIDRIGHQEYWWLVPRQRLMGWPERLMGWPGRRGRWWLCSGWFRTASRGAGGHFHGSNQAVSLSQYLLYLLETGATGYTAPQVLLDLADFRQIQLTVEERVQRAFIKMRHSCPVLPLYMLLPAGAGRGPAWFQQRLWRVPRWQQSLRN